MAVARNGRTGIPRLPAMAGASCILLAAATFVPLPCFPAFAQETQLTGTATFRERMAVPQGSLLTVSLDDVSIAGSPPVIAAQTQLPVSGAPPFSFTLPLAVGKIETGHRYMIAARISHGTTLLFTNGEGAIVDPLSDAIYPVQLILSRNSTNAK